ncbi:MAG: hypothetical protein ACPGWS_01385 [Solirubrobacterales bacterium]
MNNDKPIPEPGDEIEVAGDFGTVTAVDLNALRKPITYRSLVDGQTRRTTFLLATVMPSTAEREAAQAAIFRGWSDDERERRNQHPSPSAAIPHVLQEDGRRLAHSGPDQ